MLVSDVENDYNLVVLPVMSHRDLNWDVQSELGWVEDNSSKDQGKDRDYVTSSGEEEDADT